MNLEKYSTEKEKLEAVRENGLALQFSHNPSKKLQIEAVKKNGCAIRYVCNPSEKFQLMAVRKNGYAIQYIYNPSEEIQLEAVKQNCRVIQYIDSPSEEVIRYLLDNYISDEYVMQSLFGKIGEEGYNKLSDGDKLKLELLD